MGLHVGLDMKNKKQKKKIDKTIPQSIKQTKRAGSVRDRAGKVSSANIGQLCSLGRSRKKLFLTRNCSRCLSDSGVNSADMGMTSPARIMIALRKRGRQNKTVFI